MFFTGCAWLFADWQKRIAGDDVWQASAAWLLMLHGGGAMVTLLLLGALVPVHAHRAWRAKKNRISGSAMITLNALLIASAFGLYYVGSEIARPWISNFHIIAGFCLPAVALMHIAVGRSR